MRRRRGRVRLVTLSGAGDAGAWLLLTASFCVGAVAGHLLTGTEALDWAEPLRQMRPELAGSVPEWSIVTDLMKVLALAGVLSFSALGVAGLPLLSGVQGFSSACAVSAMVRTWGLPGLRLAALWIGLGQLPRLTALLIGGVPGWRAARSIAAGERAWREQWTGCLRWWAAAWVIGITGSVICRWLICALLPRLLPGV